MSPLDEEESRDVSVQDVEESRDVEEVEVSSYSRAHNFHLK